MRLVLLPATALLLVALTWHDPQEPPVVLYPPDRSAFTGPVDLVIAAPLGIRSLSAAWNGKPLALRRLPFDPDWVTPGVIERTASALGERQERAIWTATISKPGRHTVIVSARIKTTFFIGPGAVPAGFRRHHTHPPVPVPAGRSVCVGCHEVTRGRLGRSSTPAACAACHNETSVQLAHHHVAQPLARCGMCHDPHSAPLPKLLVDSKEKLCIRCHSGGHSKN